MNRAERRRMMRVIKPPIRATAHAIKRGRMLDPELVDKLPTSAEEGGLEETTKEV